MEEGYEIVWMSIFEMSMKCLFEMSFKPLLLKVKQFFLSFNLGGFMLGDEREDFSNNQIETVC